MKRFRVLASFIACGLLLLNLGGGFFSDLAELSAAPVADATDGALPGAPGADAVAAALPAVCRATIGIARRPAPARPLTRATPHPLPDSRPSARTWHLVERAAAAPRAPAARA